jgi:hypothetical protein
MLIHIIKIVESGKIFRLPRDFSFAFMMGEGKRKLWANAVTRIDLAFEQFCCANCWNHRHISVLSRPATANPFRRLSDLIRGIPTPECDKNTLRRTPGDEAFRGALAASAQRISRLRNG